MNRPFRDCGVEGSITLYNYQQKQWIYSDRADARKESLPASTFKIVNLLIALETGVVKDENEVIKWNGQKDTTRYGDRPETYRDLTVKEAFQLSAVWVFIEMAKKIGRDRYADYLKRCHYGNGNLSEPGDDFWNFGPLAISPVNQVEFLIGLYEAKLPFSKRNIDLVKAILLTEQTDSYRIHAKTGWSRLDGRDTGWWVGYLEREGNVYFFATRIGKPRSSYQPNFGACRKEITKDILRQLNAIK